METEVSLDPNRLWTFAEARNYLGVADSTMRHYVRTGKVPAYRLGGEGGKKILIKKADLDALLVPISAKQAESKEDTVSEEKNAGQAG